MTGRRSGCCLSLPRHVFLEMFCTASELTVKIKDLRNSMMKLLRQEEIHYYDLTLNTVYEK